jgi:excisionase family DNA binding protein
MKEQLKVEGQSQRLLVTVDEAARRLAIGRSHIYAQMQRGRLRSVHIGRSRRILDQDLTDFIAGLLEGRDMFSPEAGPLSPPRPVKVIPRRAGRR